MVNTSSSPPTATPRKKLTAHERPLFTNLTETLNELDPAGVFAFAGRLHLHDDERDVIRLFVEETKEGAKLRSFPLDGFAAGAIYEAGSEIEAGKGRLLGPQQFAITAKVPIPQWILARISNNYSEPLELRLEGMICLAEGDSVPLPERDAEADEAFRYGQYQLHTGTLLLALPTSFSGGKIGITKPQVSDPDATPLQGSLDWSTAVNGEVLLPTKSSPYSPASADSISDEETEAQRGKWQIPWIYYEPPARISIDEITKGHMFVLKYDLRTTEEEDDRGKGGWLPSIDPDFEAGVKVVVERLKVLWGDKKVLEDGGQLGIGLMGYEFPEAEEEEVKEEEEAEAESKDGEEEDSVKPTNESEAEEGGKDDAEGDEGDEVEEEEGEDWGTMMPIRQITPEEEKAFLDGLLKQFKLPDRCLVKALEEMGLQWEIGGVWLHSDDDDDEEQEDATEAIEGENGGEDGDDDIKGDKSENGEKDEQRDDQEDAEETGADEQAEKGSSAEGAEETQSAEDVITASSRTLPRSAFEQRVWGDVVTGVESIEHPDESAFRLIYKPFQVTMNGRTFTVNSITNRAAQAEQDEDDPTLQRGTWTSLPSSSVSLFCLQGLKAKDHPEAPPEFKGLSTSKLLALKGVRKDAPVYWVKLPNEYRIESSFRTDKNMTESLCIGLALFVTVPPAAER
ncbi:hypothetical protein IAU59_003997 [Kwoniella sp. CBS 9459]